MQDSFYAHLLQSLKQQVLCQAAISHKEIQTYNFGLLLLYAKDGWFTQHKVFVEWLSTQICFSIIFTFSVMPEGRQALIANVCWR